MRKQATGNFEEDDILDGDSLRRSKTKRKGNANDSVRRVVAGLDDVSNEVDQFRKIIDREGRPQVEVLEEERVLDDDAGFAETARYYYENAKDKAKGAWDEVARPFRESKQMKKELKTQEDVVKRKMAEVRKDVHKALGVIALESRQEIEDMNRLNEFKEAQYRLKEQQKDKELQEDIRRHEIEMKKIDERFAKERKEREQAQEAKAKQAKKAACTTNDVSIKPSRFMQVSTFPISMNRFSVVSSFQGEGFFGEYDGCVDEVEENIDVNAEMSLLIEVMNRSKLEELRGNKRIVFRNHDDAMEFCTVFNRVVCTLGISDYKFSDFNSGMGETPDFYSVNIDDRELEVVESFKRKETDIDVVDSVKKV